MDNAVPDYSLYSANLGFRKQLAIGRFLVLNAARLNLVGPSGLHADLPRGWTGAGWRQNQYLLDTLAPEVAELGH